MTFRHPALVSTIVALVLALGGCKIFDIDLALDGAVLDGEAMDAPMEEHLELADFCGEPDIPITDSEHHHRHTTLEGLDDDFSTLSGCGGSELRGGDGFVRLNVAAGERWHVAVEPEDPALDVAMYLLPVCDAASCSTLVDRCGAGLEEEFTLAPTRGGDYFIGIDSHGDVGEVSVLVIQTRCGDGEAQHGEVCDDGNLENGDGCDSVCRAELLDPTSAEVEPNNWPTDANVLHHPGGELTRTVVGSVGGACDEDHFSVHVPEGGTLQAVVRTGAGLACDAAPPMTLIMMDPALGVERGRGSSGGSGGECPSIEGAAFAGSLPEGEYHLVLATESDTAVDYQLAIDVTLPVGP